MRRRATLIGFVVLLLFTSGCSLVRPLPGVAHDDSPRPKPRIPFIENRGQMAGHVKFSAPTLSGTVVVTDEGKIVYALQSVAITEEVGGGGAREVTGTRASRTIVNVFRGSDPAKWQRNVPTYDAVSLGEVYAGIEVELQVVENTVEKLFHVSPGAEPAQIRMKLAGARGVTVTAQGELEIGTARGAMRFTRPVAYQDAGGKRERVEVAYVVDGDVYGFRVGDYDRGRTLVIDPLLTATFLGGQAMDHGRALALDGAGNVYVVGATLSADFPEIGIGSADSTLGEGAAFVARLSPDLSAIVAVTFLGGSTGYHDGQAVALDGAGNVYVAGTTQAADFPGVGRGAAQNSRGGALDAFVAKLDATLSTVQATYLGGTSDDEARALAVDGAGNVYVAGRTLSPDFPGIGAASADPTFSTQEAFVVKLDGELTTIHVATYLGGVSLDEALALALDGAGNVYVAGETSSSDFPGVGPRAGSADYTPGLSEAFVAKLDGDLTAILAATFLGGSANDTASALAIDGAGNVYVAGRTASVDFPGVGAASADHTAVSPNAGNNEAFVAKMTADLGTILAATFLGGSGLDGALSLAIDGLGHVYVAGYTTSVDFPGVSAGSADHTPVGQEGFVAKLAADLGTILAATYLGGSGSEVAAALAVGATGRIYVVGTTWSGDTPSTDFPGVGPGSADSTYAGFGEAFVARLEALELSGYGAIQKLKNFVDSCVPCPPTVKQTLLRHLETATQQVLDGNTRGAVSTMNLFIADTDRFVRSRQLPADVGRELTRRAREIIAELSA